MSKKDFRLINYHSHTTRCQHARGSEEEYVETALAAGFEALGFADHSPWPYTSDFVSNMRMHIRELENYIQTVSALRERYAGRLRIHLGLECEAFPEFYPWLRELRRDKGIEYLILGNHYDTSDEQDYAQRYFGKPADASLAYRYMETTIAGMQSGLFAYLAHPDLFLHRYPGFDDAAKEVCRAICESAKRLNMPLEYNLLGAKRNPESRKLGCVGYTSREFWEIAAETGNRAIIGADAHMPESLDCARDYSSARAYLGGMGIEVMESLPELDG